MPKPNIDIALDDAEEQVRPQGATRQGGKASRIDIPLDEEGITAAPLDITMAELEFVNRHHEEFKELRRRAREQEGR